MSLKMVARSLVLFTCYVIALCENSTMSKPYDTIVIGLGASGVTAASTLARAGKKVLGLEAMDRIGGRVKTVHFGDGVVELGAEWIHGTQSSRVYETAIQNNITVLPQDLTFDMFRSDGSKPDSQLIEELVGFCMSVLDDPPDMPEPLGNFTTRKLMDYLKANKPQLLEDQDFITEFLGFMNLMVNNYEASNNWNDVSTQSKYEELEGHQHMSWHRHGYKTFFELLLNRYNGAPGLPNLDIKLNTEVTKIAWPQDPAKLVTVTCKDGAVYSATNVIVTVSLGVLKERHSYLFEPPLPPEKINIIETQAMGISNKIVLSFKESWWPETRSRFGFMWREKDRITSNEDWWISGIESASSGMGSNNTLTLWTNGDEAKLIETLPDDVVKTKCIELLRRFMGKNITIPEPTGIIRSDWYSNPYTRGSYSFDSLNVSQYPNSRSDLARPLLDAAGKPRVLFAGEATDEKHFSTVHGASDSGYREASRLLQLHSKM